MPASLPAFLPGSLTLSRGTMSDYAALEHLHYVAGRPATWAGIWVVRYGSADAPPRAVAVACLSYPTLACRMRQCALGLEAMGSAERNCFVNTHIRTISRVIVHPQFRSLGLASALVRRILDDCPTRYVEALAMMGRAHPLFERAGMHRADPERPDDPIYYWLDRLAPHVAANSRL
jgi:GNAT superfamily N-acetyltransferase